MIALLVGLVVLFFLWPDDDEEESDEEDEEFVVVESRDIEPAPGLAAASALDDTDAFERDATWPLVDSPPVAH